MFEETRVNLVHGAEGAARNLSELDTAWGKQLAQHSKLVLNKLPN